MSIKTKLIKTAKVKILVVGGIDEDFHFEIGSEYLLLVKKPNLETNPVQVFDIPKGKWQLLGRLSELSEEQLGMIIPTNTKACNWKYVFPYYLSKNKTFCSTIKDSLLSLLEANDVILQNKYGEYEPDVISVPLTWESTLVSDKKLWQSEQEKVFSNPVIFIEV